MWQKIVIHHTASPVEVIRSGKLVPVNKKMVDEWHKQRGFGGIGYHFLVLNTGEVESGRPLNIIGAHCYASRRNIIGIGIALVGNFEVHQVPIKQIISTAKLSAKLMELFNIKKIEDVELHREVPLAKTLCPGKYFPKSEFLKMVAELKIQSEKINHKYTSRRPLLGV